MCFFFWAVYTFPALRNFSHLVFHIGRRHEQSSGLYYSALELCTAGTRLLVNTVVHWVKFPPPPLMSLSNASLLARVP